jgi:hypothetical protein
MGIEILSEYVLKNYDVHEWRHACAILHNDFPNEFADVTDLLEQFRLYKSWVTVGGGSKSKVSEAMDSFLGKRGWREKQFKTSVIVDKKRRNTPTHKVDCYRNRIALEIEWNNKDPFFDRDLNNFRLLFELHAISIGVIITRCDELQIIFVKLGRGKSYGNSTTHMSKLLPRIEGGSGGGCPILVFGIKDKLYVEDN